MRYTLGLNDRHPIITERVDDILLLLAQWCSFRHSTLKCIGFRRLSPPSNSASWTLLGFSTDTYDYRRGIETHASEAWWVTLIAAVVEP